MEEQTQKKEWKTPELIVLVRSKPEEAVLAVCKDALRIGPKTGGNKICVAESPDLTCTTVGIS